MEDILKLWKIKRRVLALWEDDTSKAIVYQLDKCILDLEMELEYVRTHPNANASSFAVGMEPGNPW